MTDHEAIAPVAPFALARDALQGKRILVTGASSGIGAATVKRLSLAGAMIIASGRDEKRLHEVVSESPSAVILPIDLGESGAALELIEQAVGLVDEIHGLVNSAGFGQVKRSTKFSEDDIDLHLAVNVRAAMLLAIHLGERFKSVPGSSIVNVSSIQGAVGTPHQIAYATSKGAIDAMTRALARELGPSGVRVNAVAPGLTATEMWGDALKSDEFLEGAAAGTALRRWAPPEMIADIICFLLSDAAAYITGEVITADGGFVHTGNLVPEKMFGRG